ncbi:MAG: hypothetical protein WC554_18080 [Clostridia bacterium]
MPTNLNKMINLNKHSTIALSIKDVQEYNALYEGLIFTHSLKDTSSIISKLIPKYGFKYEFLKNEGNSFPYIKISFIKDNSQRTISNVSQYLNNCGWFIADIIDINNNSFHKKNEIENIDKIKDINYIIYRAKFDTEIDLKQWPKFLYHITPYKNFKNIMKNGLIPKNENKLIKHEEYVHLYDINNSNFSLYELTKTLDAARIKNKNIEEIENKYVILKIDMSWLTHYKLFCDPDLNFSYFMKNNIHPNCISKEKIIEI